MSNKYKYPEGFFLKLKGFHNDYEVIYANGERYSQDGIAPNRVKIVHFDHGRLFETWAFPRELLPCPCGRISDFVLALKEAMRSREMVTNSISQEVEIFKFLQQRYPLLVVKCI